MACFIVSDPFVLFWAIGPRVRNRYNFDAILKTCQDGASMRGCAMGRHIRLTLRLLILPPLLLVLEALFQPNVQRFAADKELALFITHWWLTISELANMLVGMGWFWFIFGLLVGAVAVLWLAEWFSKPGIQNAPTGQT